MRFTKVERKKMTIAYRSFVVARSNQRVCRQLRAYMIRDLPDDFCNRILSVRGFPEFYRGISVTSRKCKKMTGAQLAMFRRECAHK